MRRIPPLHLVTDDPTLARPGFAAVAAEALHVGGPDVVLHLRGPETGGRRLFELAARLLPEAREAGAWLLVNDRVDVALCAGAHGAHLGQRSLPLPVAREILGEGAVLGVSVHDGDEARAATGADLLLVGTLFETPSHPGREGAGTELLITVAEAAPGIPLVGIGGITPERVGVVRGAGAEGVAVLRGVWEDRAPAAAVDRYLTTWRDAG